MGAPVGIGLRAPHYRALAAARAPVGFLEAHSENFFGGGAAPAWLERFRADHRLSLHGVGLSLGGTDPLDQGHLARLATLVGRVDPWLVSEHLSWSRVGGRHFHELLPMPFTDEAVAHLASRIQQVQDALRRPLLVENVSAYHAFAASTLDEAEFVAAVVARAGCRLLLDVNNVWVNAHNFGFDPRAYIGKLPAAAIDEIHLGGHARSGSLLVDTHGTRVCDDVWTLYRFALEQVGPRPTLIEWDADIPALEVLLDEAVRARAVMAEVERAEAVPA
jgi:uncharacterized protein (UPF0276 family)